VESVLRCKADGEEISHHETIHAATTKQGAYVALTTRELERAVSDPKIVMVRQFCTQDAIPPIYFEKPYYMVPAKGGEHAYALLREVLIRKKYGVLVNFVLRNHEYMGMIHAYGDLLLLERLRFSTDLMPRSQLKTPALPKPHPGEVDMLTAIVERFSGPVHMEDYHDEFSERIEMLIERKARGLAMPKAEQADKNATPEESVARVLAGMLEGAGTRAQL